MKERNIVLILEYDGTNYAGFQIQMNGKAVGDVLKQAIEKLVKHSIKLTAASRTDAGVHAKFQVVNFKTGCNIPQTGYVKGLNSILPADIRVIRAIEMDKDFNSRYSVLKKKYIYLIFNSPEPVSPFLSRYVWHIREPLDIEKMQEAAQVFVGTYDFSAFTTSYGRKFKTIKTIFSVDIKQQKKLLYFSFTGRSFLHNMIRIIVSAIVHVGLGRLDIDLLQELLYNKKDRKILPKTAPSSGLFLYQIEFDRKLEVVK